MHLQNQEKMLLKQMKDVEIDPIQAKVLDIGDMTEESINVRINQDVVLDHVRLKGTTDTEEVLDTLTEKEKGEGLDHLIEIDGGGLDRPIEKESEDPDPLIEKERGRGLDHLTGREESIGHEHIPEKRLIRNFLIFAK